MDQEHKDYTDHDLPPQRQISARSLTIDIAIFVLILFGALPLVAEVFTAFLKWR